MFTAKIAREFAEKVSQSPEAEIYNMVWEKYFQPIIARLVVSGHCGSYIPRSHFADIPAKSFRNAITFGTEILRFKIEEFGDGISISWD